MAKIASLFLIFFALGAVHATDKSVATTAGKIRMDVSSGQLNLFIGGTNHLSTACQLSKADSQDIKDLPPSLGASETPVKVDVQGLSAYCAIRVTQYKCTEGNGCSPEELKRVEKAETQGFDWYEPAADFKRFIKSP